MRITTYCASVVAGILWLPLAQAQEPAQPQVQEICPQINCDCGSLPIEGWQVVCRTHESKIKASCAANNNTPTAYCSLHGPSASPLPMAIHFSEVMVLPQEAIENLHKNAATMYWSVHSDLSSLKAKTSSAHFREALDLLKIMDRNLDTMFEQQRQVTISWLVYENEDEAAGAWKKYADDSRDMAEDLFAYGQELWQKYQSNTVEATRNAYKVMGFRTLRLSGKAFEMAAYAYAGSDQNKAAARAWSRGSEVSKAIMEGKRESEANSSHVSFYQHQAAARLQRASYHWALEEDSSNATEALMSAQAITPGDDALKAVIEQEESAEAQEVVDSNTAPVDAAQ